MAGITSETISSQGRDCGKKSFDPGGQRIAERRDWREKMTEEPPRKRRKQPRDGAEGSKDAPLNKKAQKKLQNLADPSALPQVIFFSRFESSCANFCRKSIIDNELMPMSSQTIVLTSMNLCEISKANLVQLIRLPWTGCPITPKSFHRQTEELPLQTLDVALAASSSPSPQSSQLHCSWEWRSESK